MTDNSHSAPKSRPSLAPMLSVRNGARAVEFYKAAFGAGEMFRADMPDGSLVVAQLSVGESDFWVTEESPENQNFSPETLGGGTVRMVLIADDPDAVFARAVAAGAKVVWPVADQSYGWRVGRVADPFGHHWEIGKPLA
ncbi:MAG TPA: VOC family protein [Candidatus Sulfotelmatobacter sp.]